MKQPPQAAAETDTDESKTQKADTHVRIRMEPRLNLAPWPDQPRQEFSKAAQEELRASMKEHGFDEAYPILGRPLEYQAVPADATKAMFRLEYRTHATSTWRQVEDDIIFPATASWRFLETQEDVDLALAWLPKFQIVDGERRWTEAGELNIHEVPCVIRPMSDREALEKALISALQKRSLNAMEEAEGFRRMIAFEPGAAPKTIAARLGVSVQYIGERIGICALRGTTAGRAIIAGTIGISHGRILGRLPTPDLIEEWSDKVMSNPWGPSPMPVRQLEEKLREHVMKELRNCGFDTTDATLVPEVREEQTGKRTMGGDCTTCPFNTRNMSDEVSKGTHMCMLPMCLRAKQNAAHESWREGAKPYGSLALEENDALWAQSGEALLFNSIYVELDERPHDLDLKPTVACNESWKKLIKGQAVQIVAARDAKGKTHLLVTKEQAIAAALENKHHIFKKEPEASAAGKAHDVDGIPAVEAAAASIEKDAASTAEAAAKALEEEERECVWQARITALVDAMSGAKQTPTGFFATLFDEFSGFFADGMSLVAQRRGVDSHTIEKSAVRENDLAMAALFIEVYLTDHWWSNGEEKGNDALQRFAKLFAVDLKAPQKAALKMLREERDARAATAEITEGMVWRENPTGETFRWNSNNVCENPERCELVFPKGMKTTASISVALTGTSEWVVGWFVQGPKFGTSDVCRVDSTKYGTRELAVRTGLLAIADQLKKAPLPIEAAVERVNAWIAEIITPPVPEEKKVKKPAKAKKVKDKRVAMAAKKWSGKGGAK